MKNILALMFSMFFVVACAGKHHGAHGSMSPEAMNGDVTPGTQMDLEVNVGDRVFFGFDSTVLDTDAQATLTRQVAWLNKHENVFVTIEGHCDVRGTREYNLALGERRAHAAKAFLVAAGINADRVKTISYGKERPAVEGMTDEAHAQNRRSVTVVGQ
jgi:peptidoglycan-associated lipoprotein